MSAGERSGPRGLLQSGASSAALFVAVVLAPSAADAGGYMLPVHGVRALSVGGAYVVGAEGADALWYNPARLFGTSVSVEAALITLGASYTGNGATVENEASPVPNPTLGGTFQIGDRLSLGLGAFAPWGAQYKFPETGPQRYSLVDSSASTFLVLEAAAALRIGDHLRLGAGLQNVIAHVRQILVLSGYTGLFGYPDDPSLDVVNEIELSDAFTPSANLGVSYDVGPVTLGLAVQLPYTVAGDADFRARLPSSVFFDPTEISGDKAYMEIDFPLMARLGCRWQIVDEVAVEVAAGYENWSVQDSIVSDTQGRVKLTDVPGIGDYVMKKITIDRRMKDTLSFHLGGDAEVIERLHVRAGFFYEPSSFGDETYSVSLLDDDKLGLGFGVSWSVGPIRFDFGAAKVFQGTRVVANSELRQINPTNPDQAIVVGNGTYETGFFVVGLGVAFIPGLDEEEPKNEPKAKKSG
ncbi:MAG: outer membrane protein transport protein [Deltaproteobacteria bacterium]|nr:outer membrane protein transport protein [Deltaproteobacteria bacterium]